MSKTNIPVDIRRNIIYKSGGRCQLCNVNLAIHGLTQLESNKKEFSHIIADSKDGPRGDATLSTVLSREESNIMLLCPECHNLFDDKKYLRKDCDIYMPQHEASALLARKQQQEKDVADLLDLLDKPRTQLVKYTARISDDYMPVIEDNEIKRVVAYSLFPEKDVVNLSHTNACGDTTTTYWETEVRQLEYNFQHNLKPLLDKEKAKRLGVFAIAPMPLLIKLGTLLRDYIDIAVYQKKKTPNTWDWEQEPNLHSYEIIEPTSKGNIIAIKISLSANIDDNRVKTVLGDNVAIWEVKHSTPNNDFLRSKKQLEVLSNTFRELYRRIGETHGNDVELHIFPAMPVSVAVEFGRVRNSKANNPLKIYDQNKKNGYAFEYVLKIE